jgi:plastocyanin
MVGPRLMGTAFGVVAAFALVGSVVAATTSVKMTEASDRYAFTPAKVFVNLGGTVTWKNTSDASHTVTSDTGSELASSTVSTNATFRHTFNAIGTFAYHCTIHPYMKGTVVVLAAGVTPPATDTVRDSSTPPNRSALSLFLMLTLASGFLFGRSYLGRRRA